MKVYSMPESFLLDQHVPARWRLLGIINGFHINGKDFYASNEWIGTQLSCSQQTVSSAVRELEELREIECIRGKTSRIIRRTLTEEGTSQLVGGYKPTRVSDTNQLVPNAISNAKNIMPSESTIRVVSDSPREEKPKSKYPHSKEVFGCWEQWPRNWSTNKTQLIAAENLYEEHGIEDIAQALRFYQKHQGYEFCPSITSPYDLDSKWAKLKAFNDKL